MNAVNRYDTSGLIENQYEPGSRGRVLKNLLGIKNKRDMEKQQTKELHRTTKELIESLSAEHRFSANDICAMHRQWLGSIYEWAGIYRQVFISKGGFPFAAPAFIPELMYEFEKNSLQPYTPCVLQERKDAATAIAIVHTEFLLIHPFREGNGRIARLLATLMALQAGLPFLDYSKLKGKKKDFYFSAVREGLNKNYAPMQQVFSDVIAWTLHVSGEQPSGPDRRP